MATDAYLRIVLTVVAVCLLFLVMQGFQRNLLLERSAGLEIGAPDRFQFVPAPRSRMAFRFDSVTGETWKMAFPAADGWIPIAVLEEGQIEFDVEAPAAPPEVKQPKKPKQRKTDEGQPKP